MIELRTRIIVGVMLVGLAALALFLGNNAMWLLAVTAGLLMMGEWASLTNAAAFGRTGQLALCVPLALMAPIAAGPGLLAFGFILGVTVFLTTISRNIKFGLGAVYVGLPIMALLWIRGQDDGLLLTAWALSLVWATDIGAYFAGRGIGGPRIAPTISPSKTWAGLVGGIISALAVGLLLARYFGLPRDLALASPILAIAAQAGDFFESWMKRTAGVKDSGRLLPGHGGALDRLDGVVSSLPLAAVLIAVTAS